MILRASPSILPMTLRYTAFAALALLSSACTYRTQTPLHQVSSDSVDATAYEQPFGTSPSYSSLSGQNAEAPLRDRTSTTPPARGNDLGFPAAGHAVEGAETVTVDAESIETQEFEAAPGTPCYEAAVKAGISNGVCTLVVERQYVLVGEKAR